MHRQIVREKKICYSKVWKTLKYLKHFYTRVGHVVVCHIFSVDNMQCFCLLFPFLLVEEINSKMLRHDEILLLLL